MKPVEDQTILVTGSTDGHGRRVAEELASHGANVIVHGRDPEKTRAVASAIGAERALVADLASLDEVRRLAGRVGRIDTLVNNAGIVSAERRTSLDGHELTFAVNYLSHFLLTALLLEGLVEPARIVNVASIGQRAARLRRSDVRARLRRLRRLRAQQAGAGHLDVRSRRPPAATAR